MDYPNNSNKNKTEQVEVMALFGYEMTPCQPLTFRRHGESETEVTELLRTTIRFAGGVALHIFDVLVGREQITSSIYWLAGKGCALSLTRVTSPGTSHNSWLCLELVS